VQPLCCHGSRSYLAAVYALRTGPDSASAPESVTADDFMQATQVARPFHTKGWVFEEKYDGWRMLGVKDAGGVRLVSRNGRDHTKRFHDIAEALAALKPKTLTLDGEVAVFDAELVSRFEWLRHINHGDLS
jgi:ATP-dependent DNA ligase